MQSVSQPSITEEELINYLESSGILLQKTQTLYQAFERSPQSNEFKNLVDQTLPQCFQAMQEKSGSKSECRKILLENLKKHESVAQSLAKILTRAHQDINSLWNLESIVTEAMDEIQKQKQKQTLAPTSKNTWTLNPTTHIYQNDMPTNSDSTHLNKRLK